MLKWLITNWHKVNFAKLIETEMDFQFEHFDWHVSSIRLDRKYIKLSFSTLNKKKSMSQNVSFVVGKCKCEKIIILRTMLQYSCKIV